MNSNSDSQSIFKVSYEQSLKTWVVALLVIGVLFILPIYASRWLASPKVEPIVSGRVAGIATDNTGRFVDVLLLGIRFDTQLRDPQTVGLLFGIILFILAILIIAIIYFWREK